MDAKTMTVSKMIDLLTDKLNEAENKCKQLHENKAPHKEWQSAAWERDAFKEHRQHVYNALYMLEIDPHA